MEYKFLILLSGNLHSFKKEKNYDIIFGPPTMALLVCINIQTKFKGIMDSQSNKENITYMKYKAPSNILVLSGLIILYEASSRTELKILSSYV